MKVILEIDHTVSKEEVVNWIEEVLKPNTPCVWGYSFEEHHCKSCHNSQLEKENAELKEQNESLADTIISQNEYIKKMKCCANCSLPYNCALCDDCKPDYKNWKLIE